MSVVKIYASFSYKSRPKLESTEQTTSFHLLIPLCVLQSVCLLKLRAIYIMQTISMVAKSWRTRKLNKGLGRHWWCALIQCYDEWARATERWFLCACVLDHIPALLCLGSKSLISQLFWSQTRWSKTHKAARLVLSASLVFPFNLIHFFLLTSIGQ
jgi:hypothetical protein